LRDEIRCLSIETDTHVGAVCEREGDGSVGKVNHIDSSWFGSLLAGRREALAISVRVDKDVGIVFGFIERLRMQVLSSMW